jgi:hypothetical protein
MFRLSSATAVVVVLACAVAISPASAQPATTYSGQATAFRASILGINLTFADTGLLPSSGGSQRVSFVGLTLPLLTVGALNASTQGRGNHSRSRSSVGDVELNLPGLPIAAEALRSEAEASCRGGEPQTGGSSDIAGLTLNGQPIVFVGLPNVVIPVLGFTVTLNEQTSSTSGNHGEITVNAVHIAGPGIDVVLASSKADIDCAE